VSTSGRKKAPTSGRKKRQLPVEPISKASGWSGLGFADSTGLRWKRIVNWICQLSDEWESIGRKKNSCLQGR
jgi:hypothetical protein